MEEEFATVIANNNWDLVPHPIGSNVVTGLERYKAHWVLHDFTQ
jgi:hypothetical protein